MANTASALKRVRSNNRKRIRNKNTRSRTRTAVRAAREAAPEDAVFVTGSLFLVGEARNLLLS